MDTTESTVEYRPIPNFPGYRVGSDGSIWSSHTNRHGPGGLWRRLATHINFNGYETVGLWLINRRYMRLVHTVVLDAFVGPRPKGLWGLHKNDQRADNRLDNLYWGTHADNIQDAKKNKRFYGPGLTLTKGEVIAIRLLTEQGITQTEIARQLGLGLSTVRGIIIDILPRVNPWDSGMCLTRRRAGSARRRLTYQLFQWFDAPTMDASPEGDTSRAHQFSHRRFNFYGYPYDTQPGEAEFSRSRTVQGMRLYPALP